MVVGRKKYRTILQVSEEAVIAVIIKSNRHGRVWSRVLGKHKKEMAFEMEVRDWERILQIEKKRKRITEEGNDTSHQSWAPRDLLKRQLIVRSWETIGTVLRNLDLFPEAKPSGEVQEWQGSSHILEGCFRQRETIASTLKYKINRLGDFEGSREGREKGA